MVQSIVFGLLLVLTMTLYGFVFPVMARFENTAAGTFRMALVLALRNPGWAVVIAVIQALTAFICWGFMYFPLLFIMGIFGYTQAAIFNRIFDPLIERGEIVETNQTYDA